MQDFEVIEKLWSNHSVEVNISSEKMLSQVKKEVAVFKRRSGMNIILMVFAVAALCVLWWAYNFSSILTDIGLGITVLSVISYALVLYSDHKLLAQTDFTAEPATCLARLKQYQLNRYRLYNSIYWLYVCALSLGTALYFVEILGYLPPQWQWIAIILTFSWIVFCSTIIRKAVIHREKERIGLLIEKFERLSQQFDSPPETL